MNLATTEINPASDAASSAQPRVCVLPSAAPATCAQPLFTLAELGLHLSRTAQAIGQALAGCPASAKVLRRGQLTNAWRLAALPAALQTALREKAALKLGQPDPAALLAESTAPWQPRFPIGQASPDRVNEADQRRAAWQIILAQPDRPARLTGELSRAGTQAYQKITGQKLSAKSFRKWFSRLIERDRGFENWSRLEIYLDENTGPVTQPGRPRHSYDHAALAHRLAFQNPARPTITERQNAFEYSFRHFAELSADHPGQSKAVKQSLLRFLSDHAPALGKTVQAIDRNWHRKHAQWTKGTRTPSAVQDQRPVNSGQFNLEDFSADLQLIAAEAWQHDGKLSLAIRKLRRAGKLSPAFTDRYTLDVRRNKSYVAKTIRRQITAYLTGTLERRRSQWAADMAGPRLARRHDYAPGDYFAADDVTFNMLWWYLDDHGQPAITRGECLVFFDCRSLYPLGYVLERGHYNGETIRRGLLHIHDRHGLPHHAFIFEQGIWKSRLLKGERPRDFLGWAEYEMRLRESGLAIDIRNVTTPGAKLIEGVFNIIQQSQRNLPGFIGFNEKEYGQEDLQTLKGRVQRGLVHPKDKLLSEDQICQAFDRSFEDYLHEPQNGELLQGQSPAEMFAQHSPLRKLADNQRFLLASHRQRVRVKQNGLALTIRGHRRFYYNEALGEYVGRDVLAFYNLEQPDLLTISDLDMKNHFSIKRHVVSAFEATSEELAEAHRARRGFMKPAKLRFDNIQHPVRRSLVRDEILDPNAQALGAHIRQQTAHFEQAKTERHRLESRIARTAEEIGIAPPVNVRDPEKVLSALRDEKRWQQDPPDPAPPEASRVPLAPLAPSVTYALDAPAPTVKQYWSLWARLEKARPGLSRHAITQETIGSHPTPSEMTSDQLACMCRVFSAILQEANPVTP